MRIIRRCPGAGSLGARHEVRKLSSASFLVDRRRSSIKNCKRKKWSQHEQALSSFAQMQLVFRLFLFLFFCSCKRKETKEKHSRFSCLRAFGRQGCGEIFLLSVLRPKSAIGTSLRLNGFRSKLVQGGLKSLC